MTEGMAARLGRSDAGITGRLLPRDFPPFGRASTRLRRKHTIGRRRRQGDKAMKIQVSKTIKMLYGRRWRKEVGCLVEAALTGSNRKTANCFTCSFITINIVVSRKGAMVTAQPDFLPELDECDLQIES